MKRIFLLSLSAIALAGCANLNKNSSNLIQDCPEMKIINRMPMIIDENNPNQLPNEYYIYEGKRREISEFDAKWVSENCDVPEQVVH